MILHTVRAEVYQKGNFVKFACLEANGDQGIRTHWWITYLFLSCFDLADKVRFGQKVYYVNKESLAQWKRKNEAVNTAESTYSTAEYINHVCFVALDKQAKKALLASDLDAALNLAEKASVIRLQDKTLHSRGEPDKQVRNHLERLITKLNLQDRVKGLKDTKNEKIAETVAIWQALKKTDTAVEGKIQDALNALEELQKNKFPDGWFQEKHAPALHQQIKMTNRFATFPTALNVLNEIAKAADAWLFQLAFLAEINKMYESVKNAISTGK